MPSEVSSSNGGASSQPTLTESVVQAAATTRTNTSYGDAGPTVSITTTVPNTLIEVSWMGVFDTVSTGGFGWIGVNIDGTDYDCQLCLTSGAAASINHPVSINFKTIIPTPKELDVKLRYKSDSGVGVRIYEPGGAPTFQVVQYA
ncbi:MAG: hypothetical protein E6R03_04715 [Hyphomicrobiaceae bacterium]|nr:MAG: hypothetical protein E6R03_04715 [Hyphomicrobiaceae bacterium]